MDVKQNAAKTLVDRIWGSDAIQSLPAKWRSALKYRVEKTPGVALETKPDEIGVNGVVNSQVVQSRINEKEKTTSTLDGGIMQHTYHNQEYDETFDVVVPVDERLTDAGEALGDPKTEIEGLIPGVDRVRTLSPNTSVLDNYLLSFPSTTSVDIPDILTDIIIAVESTVGTGSATESVDDYAWAGTHSLTVSVRASAQGHAGLTAAVIPKMVPFYGIKREVINYMFFMPAPVTSAQITTKLESLTGLTITNWSAFKPGYVTVVMFQTKESIQVAAGFTVHDSISDDGVANVRSSTQETSKESTVVVTTVRLPATLHGNLTLRDTANAPFNINQTNTATVEAHSHAPVSTHLDDNDVSVEATGKLRVVAYGLAATEGPTSLPDTGLLIVKTDARPYKYGYVMINAEVIDASTL